jgi:hypothetical protein
METEIMNNDDNSGAEANANTVARYDELKKKVEAMEDDFVAFFVRGNKAAGTRVRNAMQDLKTFAQAVRTEVQNIKNEGAAAKTPS